MIKKGLGRGFDSLIPTELLDESFDPTARQDNQMSDLRSIKVSEITADPSQPRRFFDELTLEELAQSIKIHGVLQPIVVTPNKSGGYIVVAGERRLRAAQKINLEYIPAIVRTLTDQHRLEISLIENLQRQDLNVLETATAYLKLRDQFNLTLEQIGSRVGGKSISTISNTLRLLRLPAVVKEALASDEVTEGQVRPLINLEPSIVKEILPRIIAEGWSARRVEQFVSQLKTSGFFMPVESSSKTSYEDEGKSLTKLLDTRIKTSARGSGHIIIKFSNDKEFKRINDILKGKS